MKLARRLSVASLLVASCAAVYACVGDDPVSTTPAPDGGTPPGSDSGPNEPGTDGGGDQDANGTACQGGGITCDGVCIDPSSDAKNCGRCAHDCGKGKCAMGKCEASLIVAAADGGTLITSITTDQTDDDPKGIATRIFYSVTGGGGGVFQDSVNGGNSVALSTTSAAQRTNVVVDQTNVYWFLQNFGGSAQPVVKAQVSAAGSQTGYGVMNAPYIQSILYYPDNKNVIGNYSASVSTHGVFKCPGDGGACTSMVTFTGNPGGNVAKDSANVYFSSPDEGLILRSTLNGGNSSTYIQNQATPDLLRVDGTNLYWTNKGTKTIQKGSLSGAGVAKQMASTTNTADGLAADAVNVYWTDSTTGTVNYAPITGAGPNTPYVTMGASAAPMRLVRDAGFLYFSHQGSIYRVALP